MKSITASRKNEAIMEINNFCSNCDKDVVMELLSDDYLEYRGSCPTNLIEHLELVDFNEDITVKINLTKSIDTCKVYDSVAFTKYLLKLDISNQIKQISSYFNEGHVVRLNSNSNFTTFIKANRVIHTEQVINIVNDELKSSITPYYINWLINVYVHDEVLSSYFERVRNILSLICICENKERDFSSYYLSRDNAVDIDEVRNLNSLQSNYFYQVFKWIFEDDNYNLKRSIVCNILSIQASFPESLNKNLLPLLKSNLNIVFKDNFDSYIAAKSSVMDYLFELSTRLSEEINNNKSSLNNSLLVILSFFFTSVVFTAIDKGKLENIFTYEVSVLSSAFILCSMVYLTFSQIETENATDYYDKQKVEFMTKYNTVFSQEELSDLFNPPSIQDVFIRAKSRTMFYIYQSILLFLTILIWYLHYLNL